VGKGDDALAALMQVADTGDEPCREDYVRLGDELGWKGIVASKLVEWYAQSPAGPTRNEALRGAFDRFVEVGRESDAAEVAKELARSRGADNDLATRLEAIAIKLKDLEALSVAHDLLAQALTGPPRAEELVRQAEVLRDVGVEVGEAVQHGEQGLPSVPPADAGPLLERLAKVAGTPEGIIDLYERQVTRCRAPSDRLPALARAAQVAASHGALDRARQFFDLAVSGNVQEDTLSVLEEAARTSDNELGGDRLKRTLAEALAAGGQGSRDGGRTRSAMLGRAAQLAYVDLKDVDQAFTWLGDAIVAHVDDERLDALESLALEVEQPTRAEAVLSRALEEVFDGPLVRRLLARRAALRRGKLSDMPGAASDLKRLHDLSPSDTQVMDELLELYTELKDYRGIVSLYEDQILRGKDPASRAELARKVARVWEDELVDAREAADAWRRVLRMKAGDPEASEGLERAKNAMLKRPPEEPSRPAASKSAPSAASPPVSESGLDTDEETAGESTTSTASEFSAATSEAPESETSAEEETIPGTTARMQEALASQVPQAEPSADDDDRSWNTDPAPAPLEEPSELPADDGNSEETVPGSALPKSTASNKRGGAKSSSAPSDSRPLGSAPNSSKTPSRQAPPPPGRAGRAVPASRSAAPAVAPYGAAQGDVTEVRSPSGLLDPEDNEEPAADVDDEELIDGRS
jgi:tetratricopeptide (TPR) repeat protein